MRGRLIRIVVCLGLLWGTVGLFCADTATGVVATRYHASQRTARFFRQAASSRVVRPQVVMPVSESHEKIDPTVRPVESQPTANGKTPVR
jgi:hypothetical protein